MIHAYVECDTIQYHFCCSCGHVVTVGFGVMAVGISDAPRGDEDTMADS